MSDSDPRRWLSPPAIPVIALLASWGPGRVWPIPLVWPSWTFWTGLVLFTVLHTLGIWAHRTFRCHHTSVNPRGDVVAIMADGPCYAKPDVSIALAFVRWRLAVVSATLGVGSAAAGVSCFA